MSEATAKRVTKTSAAFLILAAAFALGLAVAEFKIWPYPVVREAYGIASSVIAHGRIDPLNLIVEAPPRSARQPFTIHAPEAIDEGYYAILGWDDQVRQYSVWLYDHDGTRVHTWAVDYALLDDDGPLNGSDSPHAFKVLADGSVIVNFDNGDVMARLDACAQPLWTRSGVYHHSLEPAEDGSFWTWRGEGSAYAQYQYLVNFDPRTGETLRELGLIEDIIDRMGPDSAVFGVRPDHAFHRGPDHDADTDIFHPNDLDILSSALSDEFVDFETGDLLLSFANLHLIAVVDPDDGRMKWWSHGPWRFQHDPDFTADGWISVYSNYSQRGRSEIIKIHPQTREIANDFFAGSLSFYSDEMGKHQYLPGGNVLIVVPGEGRVLEVSGRGDVVMEFNNVVRDLKMRNAHVENAMWLAPDFFDGQPECG